MEIFKLAASVHLTTSYSTVDNFSKNLATNSVPKTFEITGFRSIGILSISINNRSSFLSKYSVEQHLQHERVRDVCPPPPQVLPGPALGPRLRICRELHKQQVLRGLSGSQEDRHRHRSGGRLAGRRYQVRIPPSLKYHCSWYGNTALALYG